MISIVVPIFNEEALIERLHSEISSAIAEIGQPWEVVYVDDGSSDRSRELLLEKQKEDERVVVARLSRNWGHQAAISAGLSLAKGDAVVMIDGDLQDPPSVIPQLIDAWQDGAEVVVAQRSGRAESGLRRLLFPVFYKVLGLLSDFPIPLNAGIFGLLDRKAVDAVNRLTETNRYLPGLRAWVGYRTEVITYQRAERAAGRPKQSFWKLLKYALDAIFSFSYKPLRLSLFFGFFTAFLAFAGGIVFLLCRLMNVPLFQKEVVAGHTSTIISVLFLGGVQLISIGILGEYIGRIYDEVKRRPLFLIEEVHREEDHRTIGP